MFAVSAIYSNICKLNALVSNNIYLMLLRMAALSNLPA